MRLAFLHFRCEGYAVRIIKGLDDFLAGLQSEEAVEASHVRDFVEVLDGRGLASADSHGDDVGIDATVHDTALMHRFNDRANGSNRASCKVLIAALLVLGAQNFCQSLLSNHLEHAVDVAIFFEAVDELGQLLTLSQLLQRFDTRPESLCLVGVL